VQNGIERGHEKSSGKRQKETVAASTKAFKAHSEDAAHTQFGSAATQRRSSDLANGQLDFRRRWRQTQAWSSDGKDYNPMEELIQRVSAAAGIDSTLAAKVIGIILAFLEKAGPSEQVAEIKAKMPGSQALIDQIASDRGDGTVIGGLMGMGGGLMGLAGELTDAGLGMSQMQGVGKEIFAYAREKAGEDTVGEVVAAIPGLSQFV
jgi:hypothetical protein